MLSLFPSRSGPQPSLSQGRLMLVRFQKIDFTNANERALSLSLSSSFSLSLHNENEQRVAIEIHNMECVYQYSSRKKVKRYTNEQKFQTSK
jgi:hypothetical protein